MNITIENSNEEVYKSINKFFLENNAMLTAKKNNDPETSTEFEYQPLFTAYTITVYFLYLNRIRVFIWGLSDDDTIIQLIPYLPKEFTSEISHYLIPTGCYS